MKILRTLLVLVFISSFSFATLTSCKEEKKDPQEQLEETADEVGDDLEEAADEVGDKIEETGEDIKEGPKM